MPQTSTEKRDRFARIFPNRVEKIVDQLRVLENCSSPSNYEWDEDVVKRTWIEIGKRFHLAAKCFGLDLEIRLNGVNVSDIDTSKQLELKA